MLEFLYVVVVEIFMLMRFDLEALIHLLGWLIRVNITFCKLRLGGVNVSFFLRLSLAFDLLALAIGVTLFYARCDS